MDMMMNDGIKFIYTTVGPIFAASLMLFIIYVVITGGKLFIQEPKAQGSSESKNKGNDKNDASNENYKIDSIEQCASILGLSGKISKSEIKQKYKELIAKYHPDKVSHLGPDLQDLANHKTKEIIAAYEFLKKVYNIE